jgi:dipeptidyl aminopeptidase/acylaminoacyl peptidase
MARRTHEALTRKRTYGWLIAVCGALVVAGAYFFWPGSNAGGGAPSGTIAFAAGGAVYSVGADGSGLRLLVPGGREVEAREQQAGGFLPARAPGWASAPAYSPDGSQIAFVRDFDIWVADADGQGARRLAVSLLEPSPGASNWSSGATNVSWSPDGSELLYGLARIGGSGLGFVEMIDLDGSERRRIEEWSAGFQLPQWGPEGRVLLTGSKGEALLQDATNTATRDALDLGDAPWPSVLQRDGDGRWLAGPFGPEGAIVFGPAGAMREVAAGVSPALSPDGEWVAYFSGDSLRLVRVDGSDDHLLVDLAPLGGRDRHFASTPDCYPERRAGCSYRPPLLSWTARQ